MWSSFQAGQPSTTYRPTAVTGTITNSTLAYDTDAYPWATSADKATVTGSAVAGTVDTDTVQYDTFASLSKSAFSSCVLQVVYSSLLGGPVVSIVPAGGGNETVTAVQSGLQVQYQIDGTNWVNLDLKNGFTSPTLSVTGLGSNSVQVTGTSPVDYSPSNTVTKKILSVNLPAASFSSNLNNLKIRFVLQTCTNSTDNTKKSSGSYNVWDIRAIVS